MKNSVHVFVNEHEIADVINVGTVSMMEALPRVWAEDLIHSGGDAYVICRLHENCEYPTNDAEVVARGLAVIFDGRNEDGTREGQLFRITIRNAQLDLDSGYIAQAQNRLSSEDAFNKWERDRELQSRRIGETHAALAALMDAPVVDLTDVERQRWERWSAQ